MKCRSYSYSEIITQKSECVLGKWIYIIALDGCSSSCMVIVEILNAVFVSVYWKVSDHYTFYRLVFEMTLTLWQSFIYFHECKQLSQVFKLYTGLKLVKVKDCDNVPSVWQHAISLAVQKIKYLEKVMNGFYNILWAVTVSLTRNKSDYLSAYLCIQYIYIYIYIYIWLGLLVVHHHTKFGWKRLSGSEDIVLT